MTWTIGLAGYTGNATAAGEWGGATTRMQVQPRSPGNHTTPFDAGAPAFAVRPRDRADRLPAGPRQRAIGVRARPESERLSQSFEADIGRQFDAAAQLTTTLASCGCTSR